VLSAVRHRLSHTLRRAAGDPAHAALGVSAAAHLALFALLACLWLDLRELPSAAALDSRWTPAEMPLPLVDVEPPAAETVIELTDGGRSAADSVAIAEQPALFPTLPTTAPSEADAELLLAGGLADEVGAVASGDDDGDGGSGTGQGGGAGDGDGRFFGAEGHGRRFVYVVDRSGSMNYPHDSEAKTRFRRLKFELLNSIGRMTPDMEFFIVFFNEDAHPMPAPALQPATRQAKAHYLEWMSKVRAVGRTDPRDALRVALRLKPDTIYFLSDGAFPHQVNVELQQIRQRGIVIHTFAFGDTGGQETLEHVARSNGGKYHFVP
jgi:hypothetical protein